MNVNTFIFENPASMSIIIDEKKPVVHHETRETAFKQALQLVDFTIPSLSSSSSALNIEEHLELLRDTITTVIIKLLKEHINVKVWLVQEVDYSPILELEKTNRAY